MKIKQTLLSATLTLPFLLHASEAGKSVFAFVHGKDNIIFSYGKAYHNGGIQLLELKCGEHSQIGKPIVSHIDYDMKTGKKKHCTNTCTEYKYLLADKDTLWIRQFEDGFAWKKSGMSKIELINPTHIWLQEWTEPYEHFFPKDPQWEEGKRIGYPALVEYKDGVFGLLSESGLTVDNAGSCMYLKGKNTFDIVPDGKEDGGWQTMIVGTLPEVVESTLIHDNSAPSILEDDSWVEPGVASWVYWAYNHGSNDFNIIQKYVDMADELNLPYVLIDAEWDEMKDGKTIEDAVAYAVSKGVKPMIWYNSSVGWVNGAPGPKYRLNKPEDLEKEFAWCRKIGVKGVKIDFFSGDTNLNWRFMDELLRAGAKHKLLVNFHGSPLPRGWQRTYPNFITTESVYGEEWYNNVPSFTDKAAAHNATLPFTRNVIGSMDYTPCAFTDSQHPHITTNAHELALTTLYESGIQHLADRPESFLSQPQQVKDFLTELPAAWDDTVLLGGYPGEYAMMARKKDGKWWISAINGTDSPFELTDIDYSRLGLDGSKLNVRIFEDAAPGSPDKWKITDTTSLPASFNLLPRGGLLMTIIQNNNHEI